MTMGKVGDCTRSADAKKSSTNFCTVPCKGILNCNHCQAVGGAKGSDFAGEEAGEVDLRDGLGQGGPERRGGGVKALSPTRERRQAAVIASTQ